jgi:hypothetical protein
MAAMCIYVILLVLKAAGLSNWGKNGLIAAQQVKSSQKSAFVGRKVLTESTQTVMLKLDSGFVHTV